MDIKNKHVAVAYDNNGNCEFVAKVKVVNDRELNRLLNEQEQHKQHELLKHEELKKQVSANKENIDTFTKGFIGIIAKSIYDNFVDRGLIDNDDDFQQMWYDYYFNDKELDLDNAPQEYLKIFERLVAEYEEDKQ